MTSETAITAASSIISVAHSVAPGDPSGFLRSYLNVMPEQDRHPHLIEMLEHQLYLMECPRHN